MTPLPKRKLSRKRQGKRRAAFKISLSAMVSCPNCHKLTLAHRVCRNCGYYNSRAVRPIVTASPKN